MLTASLISQFPALIVVLPLLASILCAFLRHGTIAWGLTCLVSWLMFFISLALFFEVLLGGPISYKMGGWAPPWGIEYRVDELSSFMLFLISLVTIIIVPYAKKSVESEIREEHHSWFYTMFLLCLTGTVGITITGDAFNIFVFLEISSLATYVIIALGKDRRALVAAYQYLIMGTIGATFYVIGIGLLYTVTGTLNLVDIAERIKDIETTRPVLAALAFLTVGISLKLALFPLHVWLPNAYAYAPSFATAFLAATATKAAVYLLLRFFFMVFGGTSLFASVPVAEIILGLSLAAMFGASLVAVFQENIKRMLAYSSIAQIGYITLGISLANQTGLTGGIVHLFNHALTKAALFLVMGAIFYRLGSVKINDLAGLGRRMPVTMGAFVIAGLSIIGVPGTAGFITKWYLALGALENGAWPLVFLLVASSVISIIYIGRVVEVAWFRPLSKAAEKASDPPFLMLAPIIIFVAAAVYFGLDTTLSVGPASRAADLLIGGLR